MRFNLNSSYVSTPPTTHLWSWPQHFSTYSDLWNLVVNLDRSINALAFLVLFFIFDTERIAKHDIALPYIYINSNIYCHLIRVYCYVYIPDKLGFHYLVVHYATLCSHRECECMSPYGLMILLLLMMLMLMVVLDVDSNAEPLADGIIGL